MCNSPFFQHYQSLNQGYRTLAHLRSLRDAFANLTLQNTRRPFVTRFITGRADAIRAERNHALVMQAESHISHTERILKEVDALFHRTMHAHLVQKDDEYRARSEKKTALAALLEQVQRHISLTKNFASFVDFALEALPANGGAAASAPEAIEDWIQAAMSLSDSFARLGRLSQRYDAAPACPRTPQALALSPIVNADRRSILTTPVAEKRELLLAHRAAAAAELSLLTHYAETLRVADEALGELLAQRRLGAVFRETPAEQQLVEASA